MMSIGIFHPFRTIRNFTETCISKYKLRKCNYIGKNIKIKFPIYTFGLENISIGYNFHAGERLKLRTFNNWKGHRMNPKIIIGNNVNIESDCHISAINEVIIEDNVLIASFVFVSDHSHGKSDSDEMDIPPIERSLFSKGPIIIRKNAWLGEKVIVLPGVTIGEGSIVGAGAVVTKDIPPFSVAVGNPARIIKTLK